VAGLSSSFQESSYILATLVIFSGDFFDFGDFSFLFKDYNVASSISGPNSICIVRQQLFFTCTLYPLKAKADRYHRS
jgi:hypothetical protein